MTIEGIGLLMICHGNGERYFLSPVKDVI